MTLTEFNPSLDALEADILESHLATWVSGVRLRSPETGRKYETAVRRFLRHLDGHPITDTTVASYLDTLGASNLAPASVNHYVSALRQYLRFLAKRCIVDPSVLDVLRSPHVEVTSAGRYVDVDELLLLIRTAQQQSPLHHATVLLLAGAGLRVSEAANARWCDVYTDPHGRLGLRVQGKGGRHRVVAVLPEVFESLAVLHGDTRLDANDPTPLLRRSHQGDVRKPLKSRRLRQLVAETVEASGLSKPVSPHWLRHTYATLAALGGAPAFSIQQSLGHARLETAQRYIHWAHGLAGSASAYLPSLSDE